jgi:hypothetical protein
LGLLYYDHRERDSGSIDRVFAWVFKVTGTHHVHTAFKIGAAVLMLISAVAIVLS